MTATGTVICRAPFPDLLWRGDAQVALNTLRALRPAASPDAEPVRHLEGTIAYLEGQRAWLGHYAVGRTQASPWAVD